MPNSPICIWRTVPLIFILFVGISNPHADPVCVLIEKKSAFLQAPLKGFRQIVKTKALVFDMNRNEAEGKTHCATMKQKKCKIVFAIGKKAAKAVMSHLPNTPMVYSMVMSPAATGIKGPQVTGVSLDIPMTKQFESFKSVVPGLKSVGLVYSDDVHKSLAEEMRQASKKNGITLIEKKILNDTEVPKAFRKLKGNVDGLYLPPDRKVAKRDAFQFIALFTFENNLPFMAPTGRFVKKGALIAMMADYEALGKQAGKMAQKILAGASPSTVKPEPPQSTILVLNQKTAETIGINIPPALLQGSQIIR